MSVDPPPVSLSRGEIEDWTDRAARRMCEDAGLGPTTLTYSILTTAMHRWRSSFSRAFSGTASNAAMPSRFTRAMSGPRDRIRSLRAAAILGKGAHPYGHVHRQHRAAPRHGRRPAGQGSGRDCARGIHDTKQWRLDHDRQTPELTAGHGFALNGILTETMHSDHKQSAFGNLTHPIRLLMFKSRRSYAR
jgi:hypothetical protein